MKVNIESSKSVFWVLLNVVLGLIIIFAFVGIGAFYKVTRGVEGQRTFAVTGEAKVATAPDLATLTFAVVTEGSKPENLQEENTKKINAVIAYVKGQDIAKEDVQTSGYNLYPKYNYNRNTGESDIVGYTLTQNVTVKIRDLESVGTIIGGLTNLGVNQINTVQFTIEDQDAAQEEAREEAIEKARAKAKSLADKAGIRLGRVIDIQESGGGYPPYYMRESAVMGMGSSDAVKAPTPTMPTIEPGTQDVYVSVTLVYEVR